MGGSAEREEMEQRKTSRALNVFIDHQNEVGTDTTKAKSQ
jgi:hypothetical protein